MPSTWVIVATVHLVQVILVREVFSVTMCASNSLQRFGGVSIAAYTPCCLDDDELIQQLNKYFDAYQDNRIDEAMKILENIKSHNVSARNLFASRSVTAIVSVILSADGAYRENALY